jgi:hypothetical protein
VLKVELNSQGLVADFGRGRKKTKGENEFDQLLPDITRATLNDPSLTRCGTNQNCVDPKNISSLIAHQTLLLGRSV